MALEILPWGQTREDRDKIDAKRQAGRNGCAGCLFYLVAFTLVAVFAWGWMLGRNDSLRPVGHSEAVTKE